ncbi:MAG: FG-GAP-like repeat-containing protein [Gaiellaceae bacterium]
MSTAATVGSGGRTLLIRGTAYPVLLPTFRDPRLHLAAVIVSLQVLGQAAFRFELSIAQILAALGTCALLEFSIALWRHRVIMWPASALLTGNGVAFVLRIPGTQHGDWWSLRGWWIYVGTAAVALLSKHVIRFRGRHIFNPSNIGLVLCFLILGKDRANPLDFWWARMSFWLALALVIIGAGGLLILSRLKLLAIAIGFWLSFAAGIGVLALTDHAMTARWHLGPITGAYFWWVLITSPEVLVFLFFMITDPKTIPEGARARRLYAVAVGVLAALLIAPQTTEFASKVALLGALAIVCAVHPFLTAFGGRAWAAARWNRLGTRRPLVLAAAAAGVAVLGGSIALAGIPARLDATPVLQPTNVNRLPVVTVLPSKGVESQLTRATALQIARNLVADLQIEANALRRRDAAHAATGASGGWLAGLQQLLHDTAGKPIAVPTYDVATVSVHLEAGEGQGPPRAVATLAGTVQITTYDPSTFAATHTASRSRFTQTFELTPEGTRYLISRSRRASSRELVTPTLGAAPANAPPPVSATTSRAVAAGFAGVKLRNVASQVGLDFRQDAFRFGVTPDTQAMMGGGVCWLDYDNDGWLDLFAVNSYSDANIPDWQQRGGLPESALFHNEHGRFTNVSRVSGAGVRVKGTGCVAADFNGDGHTDLYVVTAVDDKLLWNNGNGTFTEGARAAGVVSFGWHSGAAVADVNGDGRPDLFVAGYTEVNAPTPGSSAGFPTNHLGVRDLLFLNQGNGANGRARFREVGVRAGLESSHFEHALGAVFTDVNGDGRPDLYVANDEDPNRLYLNEATTGGLEFRFVERGQKDGVADANAGMGVAAADYNGDGLPDLFVSNSREQAHGIFRSRSPGAVGPAYAGARSDFTAAFGSSFAGWGTSWVDLNRDGNLDLVLANGDIPITNLAKDARPVQVLENLTGQGFAEQFADASKLPGLLDLPALNGRGLAAADFDNDGNVDLAINSIGGPLVLLQNTNRSGHWLEVALTGFHPNAVVTAVLPDGRRLVRELQTGSSYLSSEDPRAFFGLGTATTVKTLIVRLPSGQEARRSNVSGDRVIVVNP